MTKYLPLLAPSVILLLLGTAGAFFFGVKQRLRGAVALFIFVLILLSVSYVGVDMLSGDGLNEAVVYHLMADFGGAAVTDFLWLIVSAVAAVLAGGLLCWRMAKGIRGAESWRGFVLFLVMAGTSLLVHPLTKEIERLRRTYSDVKDSNPAFDRSYKQPQALERATTGMNVVYIYAESFERTYFNEQAFPGLITELKKWESKATSFTNVQQVWGTGWTIAGIVASQCAIPLVTPGSGENNMEAFGGFLSDAVCLGDLLSQAGYRLTFMGGADLRFAGKGNFYSAHGFQEVLGRNDLVPHLPDHSYLNGWGLYDDTLFDLAFDKYGELSASGKPFALFTLTVDTHHPKGYVSRNCNGIQYGDGRNEMLNAVKCSDAVIGQFIQRIHDSPAGRNTLVVVGSDHLAMPNGAYDVLQSKPRRNLLFVIDPRDMRGRVVAVTGSTLDIAPTLLSMMGYTVDKLGLGRDLQSEKSLLATESGFSERLAEWTPSLRRFWALPNLGQGIQLSKANKKLSIGSISLEYPVMLKFDEALNVRSVDFQDKLDKFAEMSRGGGFLSVLDCSYVMADSGVSGRGGEPCLVVGNGSGGDSMIIPLDKPHYSWDYKQFREILNAVPSAEPRAYHGNIETEGVVVSSGGLARPSGVFARTPFGFSRGMNVFGVRDGLVTFIENIDLCTKPDLPVDGGFMNVVADRQKDFDFIGVAVHDSAFCHDQGVDGFFIGTRLKRFSSIRFRTPYLGIVDSAGKVKAELVDKSESEVRFRLSDLYREKTG